MSTERVNPRTIDLDLLDDGDLLTLLVDEQVRAVTRVASTVTAHGPLIELSANALDRGGRLVYLAAGTSGLLAAADLAEIPATFGFEGARLAIVRPDTGPGEDDGPAATAAVTDLGLGPNDVVVGIAASGATRWVAAGLKTARAQRASTIAVVNNANREVSLAAAHVVVLDTGPEPLTGSTRMAAGLAQKLWLTSFSTAVMIRLGCTYGNLMTRARGSLEKLDLRRVRTVAIATGLNETAAKELLSDADNDVEVAILMGNLNIGIAGSRAILADAGSLRAALERP